jgi:hypothetical protein
MPEQARTGGAGAPGSATTSTTSAAQPDWGAQLPPEANDVCKRNVARLEGVFSGLRALNPADRVRISVRVADASRLASLNTQRLGEHLKTLPILKKWFWRTLFWSWALAPFGVAAVAGDSTTSFWAALLPVYCAFFTGSILYVGLPIFVWLAGNKFKWLQAPKKLVIQPGLRYGLVVLALNTIVHEVFVGRDFTSLGWAAGVTYDFLAGLMTVLLCLRWLLTAHHIKRGDAMKSADELLIVASLEFLGEVESAPLDKVESRSKLTHSLEELSRLARKCVLMQVDHVSKDLCAFQRIRPVIPIISGHPFQFNPANSAMV